MMQTGRRRSVLICGFGSIGKRHFRNLRSSFPHYPVAVYDPRRDPFGLQPHRSETFKLSNDPLLIEKLRDIVGLYLNPPEHAAVFCVDEQSQIQALDAPSRCCRCGRGKPNGGRTTTSGTARRPCLRRSMWKPAS